jgi:glycosyltransferase involved in cell wall biosynthesis
VHPSDTFLQKIVKTVKERKVMRVLWLTNIPSPYRVEFFNELGKHCELTVLFEKGAADDRDDSWKNYRAKNFTPVILKGVRHGVAEAFCVDVWRYLSKKKYDRIVVTNYANPTGMLAVAAMRLRGIPYTIEGDGAFAGTGKGFKEWIKTWLLHKAELCFSTAAEHDKYYRTYGVPEERIVRYPFTSLRSADVLDEPVSAEEKAVLRKKLGMRDQKIVVSVGQFIYRKGFDILFEALAKMENNIGCYIIGGQPTEAYLQQVENLGLKNVHFVGFKQKSELAEYYMAADAFVLPTREDIWGLVINEAMAKGLPVVTTNRCVAGLELITDPALGRIVPVGDKKALAEALDAVLENVNTQTGQRVIAAIRPYTIECMAKRHIEILEG